MSNCPSCNTKLPKYANFCINCGAKINVVETSGKSKVSGKTKGLSKIKSLFKMESGDDQDNESNLDVLKPEVMTIPQVSEAMALQLPVLQECGVCQGEITAGEIFIRCYCELITHVECVSEEQICPQCHRELDLELLLPKNYEKKKATKKPTIYKEDKREIEELTPPSTSYFAHIPQLTKENRIKDFVSTYYDKHELGKLKEIKNALDIDMFI